ncbi:hypothetical protein DXG01_003531 [Tephrocybe rancida]|nr:hypothetical protein DXG01_003531 [Tephrocybe rancida]
MGEMRLTTTGRMYFVDHTTKITSWEDPRISYVDHAVLTHIVNIRRKVIYFRSQPAMRTGDGILAIQIRKDHVFEDGFAALMGHATDELKKRLVVQVGAGDCVHHGGSLRFIGRCLGLSIFHRRLLDVSSITGLHRTILKKGSSSGIGQPNNEEYMDSDSSVVEDQLEAVASGLMELIPEELIRIFDEQEFGLLIGGVSEINVDDWESHTDYEGYAATDDVIKWFWSCMRNATQARMSKVLEFVTGTPRVSASGFKGLTGGNSLHRFTIARSGDTSQPPKSHKCQNTLNLPPYSDCESLERQLARALENT